jgi:DNA-binding MarR family transcriptional regulator
MSSNDAHTVPLVTIREELFQTRPFPSTSEEAVVALLRTADVMGRFVDDLIECSGITGQQYNVLRILRGAGTAGLPTLDIAERMIEQTPGITRLIDRLEEKGLVTRERCATDRRQVFCRIGEAGLALLDRLDEPVKDAAAEAFAGLKGTEVAQLITLLDRTRDHVNQQFAFREQKPTQKPARSLV